jgi:1-acyl-sn-glycerol-3-phosphate acyltransferase
LKRETLKRATSNLLSWLRSTLIFWPIIFVITLILEPISLLAGVCDRSGRARHAVARMWAAICLRLVAHVKVEGLDKIDPGRARLYVANHLSSLDIPLLYAYLPFPFRIMAHRKVFRVPLIGWWLRASGSLEIAPESVALGRSALLEAIATLKNGMSLAIFPEGERSPTGHMLRFRPGAFYVAVKAQVEVVPMVILGTYEALPVRSAHLKTGRLEFVVGEPISVDGYTRKDLRALAERVQKAVRELCDSRVASR